MGIVIKKKVSLNFLGEDYKGSYLIVKSISVGEYEKLSDESVKDTVISRFLDGKIKQDGEMIDITRDNLEELPGEVFVEAFKAMTGITDEETGAIYPKVEGQ